MQLAALTALCAFSRSLLTSPLLPRQMNMIIAMLQMRDVRLRKITWPPQATQCGGARVSGQNWHSAEARWGLDNVARRSPCLGCGKKAIALALLSTESEALYKEANVDNSQLFRAREAGPARLLHPCWLGRSKCHY